MCLWIRCARVYVCDGDGDMEITYLEDCLKSKGVELICANDTEIRMFSKNILGIGGYKCVSYKWNERTMGILEERDLDVILCLFGGTHLSGRSDEYLESIMTEHRGFGFKLFSLSHCTGFKATTRTWKAFP